MSQTTRGPGDQKLGNPATTGGTAPPSTPQARVADTDEETLARLQVPVTRPDRPPSTAWQSWAYFGATMMCLMGVFWAMFGLLALIDQAYFQAKPNSLLAFQSYVAWGWVHIIGGVLALVVGVGILMGAARWARISGIVIAALSAIINLGFVEASPVWATIVIGLDVLVIYALAVHGAEMDYRE